MSPRVNIVNRTVLLLLALLLIAAGVLGLILGFGGFGASRSTTAVLPVELRSFPADQPWFWWAVAAGCLLVALLGLWWLLAQLKTERIGRLDITTDDRAGSTTVHSSAITNAVEAEAQGIAGVSDATAHVRGESERRLVLSVDLDDNADLATVRAHLEQQTVPHLRRALDDPTFAVDIELRPGAKRSARALA